MWIKNFNALQGLKLFENFWAHQGIILLLWLPVLIIGQSNPGEKYSIVTQNFVYTRQAVI